MVTFASPPSKRDTLLYPIRQISFDNSFRTDSLPVDTSINKLQILNPAYKNDHSSVTLIRLGYPLISNNIIRRIQNNDIIFQANSFQPYIQDLRNNFFYDTRKPFTSLTYKSQGSQSNSEEYLQVLHTQNLTRKTNIGLFYNLYSAYSKYNNQQTSDHALNIFYRFTGNNYLTYNQFYFNSFKTQENGGITKDTLVNYKTGAYEGMEVYLQNANSKFKRMGFNSIHELKFKALFENEKDTLSSTNKDYGSIIYNLNLENNKRNYTDDLSDQPIDIPLLYKNSFNRTNTSNDSIVLNKISNKIVLNSPYLSKYLPNLRFSLNNDLYYSFMSIPKDSIIFNNDTLTNQKSKDIHQSTYASLDVSQKFRQIWWNFIWDTYLLGYNSGDQSLSLSANLFLDKAKSIGCVLKATQESRTPTFFYNRYLSNHYIWFKDLKREMKQTFSAVASTKNPSVSISANYASISKFIYFSSDSILDQAQNPMYILSFTLNNDINLWKFNIENSILYQKNSSSYINTPEFILYNSTTFNHTIHFFTGGKLFFRLGFDLYYRTKYKPDAYNPAIGAFYLQNSKELSDYPQVDFHLTIKIKTVSFFFKYTHANAGFNGERQFTALHYPMLPAIFSYGINWLFYD